MNCTCRSSCLGFTEWSRFQDAAMAGDGFGNIPEVPGVYSLRALRVGKRDPAATIARYLESSLFAALQAMSNASETFFLDCGLGPSWGWKWYADEAAKHVDSIRSLVIGPDGALPCPTLYIGCSNSLRRRMGELMWIAHPANHPLWALLYSGWPVELAVRGADDFKDEERKIKALYRGEHGGQLPPLMKK